VPTKYARASAGTTIHACSILVRKLQPTKNAHHISHEVRPRAEEARTARVTAYAAAISSRTSRVSGLFVRLIATVTGVSAKINAASSATRSPAHRRTVRCSRKTAATPAITSGSSSDQPWYPKIRTETTCGHSAIGGLSTVTTPYGSKEPKRKFGRLPVIDLIAAE
jgi:hypothetical protein